jgi:hypothetical protein
MGTTALTGSALAAITFAACWFVLWPLVARDKGENPTELRLAELEERKQAKYRELDDAQLDREMEKLSNADYTDTKRALELEAVELLEQIRAERAAVTPGPREEP